MNQLIFRQRWLLRRCMQLIGSRFYINPKPDIEHSILVAGAARSGTTWLGDLIAAHIPCRILFEPFNPNLVQEYRHFNYFQYMRPTAENRQFFEFANRVFRGQIRNRWIDHQNERFFARYRLIKEIRINLALKYLRNQFPQVPLIFMMRHPCAVVLSRMELGWATGQDIEPLLSQSELIEDHLSTFLDLIRSTVVEEEKHAIIWAIHNLIPLKQFSHRELKIVHYETLCTQPQRELSSVLDFIGQSDQPMLMNMIQRPSQTARSTSAVVQGASQIDKWSKKLTNRQIDNILKVVDKFGLGHLYDSSFLPQNVALP